MQKKTRRTLLASTAAPLSLLGLAFGVDLLGAHGALASNECGTPSGGTVTCGPGAYPTGITYTTPSNLSVTLQQAPAAAVNVQTGGINLTSPFVPNTSATLNLTRSFTGAPSTLSTAPSIRNTSGAALTVSNGNGGVNVDLGDPATDAGISLIGATDGVDVLSQTGTSITLTDGAVTAQNGSAINVTSNGAVAISTGGAQLSAANGAVILVEQTGSSGAISVQTAGALTATTYQVGDGIQIRASNALNTSDISVNVANTIIAQGAAIDVISTAPRNVFVTLQAGTSLTAQEDGIFATTGGSGAISVTTATGSSILGDSNNGGIGDGINLSTASGAITLNTAAGSNILVGSNLASPLLNHPQKDVESLVSTSGDITVVNGANLLNTTTAGGFAYFANGIYTVTAGNISINSSGAIGSATSIMGNIGIDATVMPGAGNLQIVNTGTINSQYQGILATNQGSGAVNVSTTGAIISSSESAISTAAQSGATNISVGAGLTAPNGAGVVSTSTSGAVNVSVLGTTTISANSGVNISTAGGDATINNAGRVSASSVGLQASISGGSGDLTITNTGAVVANGSAAIEASNAGSGATVITASGPISAARGNGVQSIATTGSTTVNLSSTISAPTSFGAYTASTSGAISVNLAQGTAIVASNGMTASTQGGAVSLSNGGQITASDSGLAAQITGGAGDLSVLNTGTINAAGTAGISANTTGTGAVSVNSTGSLTAANGAAIVTTAASGATGITVGGTVSGNFGVLASSTTGAISVGIQSGTTFGGAIAVNAVSQSGDVTVSNAATLNESVTGVYAKTGGPGSVSVVSSGPISATGSAIDAEVTGSGSVTISTTAATTSTQAPTLFALATSGATTINVAGNVTSTVDNAVSAQSTSGAISFTTAAGQQLSGVNGLVAQTDSGAINISNGSIISAQYEAIRAKLASGAQALTVVNSGTLSSSGAAVVELDNGGSGTTNFTTSGSISANNGFGVLATGASGAINLNVNANVTASQGNAILVSAASSPVTLNVGTGAVLQSSSGVLLFSRTGALSVTNAGTISATTATPPSASGVAFVTQSNVTLTNTSGATITGVGSSGASAAISILNPTSITATNSGTINTASTSHNGIAWYNYATTGGASGSPTISLTNTAGGLIDGVIFNNTNGPMTFNNAGTWTVFGATSALGVSQTGVLNNSGLLQVGFSGATGTAPTSTFITGVSITNNSGVISLVNGVGNNFLSISGAYVGSGAATLNLDFKAGSPTTDLLKLGGTATGSTAVKLNLLGTQPLFATTPIVDAATSSSPTAFVLSGTPHQGFADFHIVYDATTGVFSVVSTPNTAAYETVKFAEAGRNLYWASAAAWSSHLQQNREVEAQSSEVREGFSAWGQVFGDSYGYSDTRTLTADSITGVFNLNYNQSTFGVETGFDVTKEIGGGSATIGMLAGYAHSSIGFSATGDNASIDEFNGGAFVALTRNHWFLNGLVKFDLGNFHVSSAYANYAQTLSLGQAGGSVEFGRRFSTRSWYVEPSVGATIAAGGFGRRGSDLNISSFTANGVTFDLGKASGIQVKAGFTAGTAPVHALGGLLSPYAGLAVVDEPTSGNHLALVSNSTSMYLANRALGLQGEMRAGAQLMLARGVTLSAEAKGEAGQRMAGGGGRVAARWTW